MHKAVIDMGTNSTPAGSGFFTGWNLKNGVYASAGNPLG